MNPEKGAEIIREITRRQQGLLTLENILTSQAGFGLTSATPLQRAICRIADGLALGELVHHPDIAECIAERIAIDGRPEELTILSGTRTAKSLIVAALAVRATQTCKVEHLGAGEMPRYSIISLRKDLADVIFGHIVGNLLAKPQLKTLLAEEPTSDSIILRHPSGRPVEIKVVAGAKAGATLVARWSIGAVFDEFPRMVGSEDGVVNYDDMRNAILSRLLPGAMVANIGSPWAPFGPAYDKVGTSWRKPSKKSVLIWAKADKMNPVWWTPERAAALAEADADAYRTDYLAQFLEPEELFFSASLIESQTRKSPDRLPRVAGYTYYAAMDPATRNNAWTLVIGTRNGPLRKVALARQWVPGNNPLDPRSVLEDIAIECQSYGVTTVKTDQWAVDALRPLAQDAGITLVQQDLSGQQHYDAYKTAQTWLTLGQLELAPVPALIDDLKRVKRRVTQSGMSIVLPKTSDGRHCDYAPSLVRMLTGLHGDYEEAAPEIGTRARADFEMRQLEDDEEREYKTKLKDRNWFDNTTKRGSARDRARH